MVSARARATVRGGERYSYSAYLLIIARRPLPTKALPPVRLDELPLKSPARIASIEWSALVPAEARRLRELGFDEGMEIQTLHSGSILGRDPIACRVGRMTIALRRAAASAIVVEPA